jgi:hypothetical protein
MPGGLNIQLLFVKSHGVGATSQLPICAMQPSTLYGTHLYQLKVLEVLWVVEVNQ